MSQKILPLILCCGAILFFQTTTFAQEDDGCMEADCHSDMGTKEWIHGPVGAGACTVCHNPLENVDHQFVLATEKEELCFNCHETSRDMMLSDFLHTPVSEGNCVGCHDPHQSDYRFTLKGTASELCFNCHEREGFEREAVHGPVAAGDCNACHNPHASSFEKQLLSPPDELCFNCHEEQADIPDMRHGHAPVEEKCTNCHDPHSNTSEYLLPDDPPGLCYGCHEEIMEYASASTPHAPVENGDCDGCHNVHGSDNPMLFTVAQTDLCFSCHEELQEFVAEQEFLHGPVQDGDCNACHDPHGSENHRILRMDFPEEFYKPYSPENYALCFDCHNEEIVEDEKTTTLTDFRDADRNLHYLHVNKMEKGRSCRACHQVHASSQQKHIRTSVPYGSIGWELPVKFTKTETGGSCRVGCHKPKEYARYESP